MNYDKHKMIKMLLILSLVCLIVGGITQISKKNRMSLSDYAAQNPEIAYHVAEETKQTESAETPGTISTQETAEILQNEPKEDIIPAISTLPGANLNGKTFLQDRITYADGFYYEPLSDNLRRYITGVSFPSIMENENTDTAYKGVKNDIQGDSDTSAGSSEEVTPAITYEDLSYLHILHYDFAGNPAEGELICNNAIAQDLVEIFYQLYINEYQIEKVHLIDEYDGDDIASMEDNNTSCFNYRVVEGSSSLSKHAYGMALDINPLYNPYVTYNADGSEQVSPTTAEVYSDRTSSFPYKIDENDLCYKLFTEHGFTWGGNWNSCKDYQHFQKKLP